MTEEILKNNIKIVEHYGIKSQMPIWIEEMSELTKKICKWNRQYDKLNGDINTQLLNNIKEEITDVIVCLDQLRYVVNFTEDDLMKEYKFKIDRQLSRILKEDDKK